MNKSVVVMCASEDVHIESKRVDVDLKNGVYSYSDAQSDAVIIVVTDVDLSQEMLEAMRQYYYHVLCNCDFLVPSSDLRRNVEQNQQLYKEFNEVFERFLTFDEKYESYKSLEHFDYETHKSLIEQYK